MRTSLSLVLLSLAVALGVGACQTNIYKTGKGPITISSNTLAGFEKYKLEAVPGYFALANDGNGSGYTHCPVMYHMGCVDDSGDRARRSCDQNAKLRGAECFTFAIGREVVWKGPVTYPSYGDDYLVLFAKGIGRSINWGGKGNLIDGGRKITLRIGECRGEADISTKKWYLKECKNNYSAYGTFAAGSGSEKYYGVGKDNKGEDVEIKILLPGSSGGKISKASVSTSSPNITNRKPPPEKWKTWRWNSPVFKRGVALYERGDFAGALKEWKSLAIKGDATLEYYRASAQQKLARLDAGNPASTPTKPSTGSPKTRPIAVEWEGYRKLIAGKIELDEQKGGGTISMLLPDNDGSCTGSYKYDSKRSGSWAMACTNGMAASGTFESHGKGKGSSGEGTDTKGRKVRYTLGAG